MVEGTRRNAALIKGDHQDEYYKKAVPEPFGVALKESPEKLIGTVGCFWVSRQARSMELAYAIGEEHWGKGLVPEAASAVVEKVGMTYEGTLKSAVFQRSRYWDMDYSARVSFSSDY